MTGPTTPRSFGVEEEYLLLDRLTGTPTNNAAQLIRDVPEQDADREFFSSQLETATPVCRTRDEALRSLQEFRASFSRSASDRGMVLAGTGLPPVGGEVPGSITPSERYHAIANELRGAAATQYMTGTHVHVEVPSRDVGVEVLARLARWTPALTAITANSPIWCGDDTGFASWRHLISASWPLKGYPPQFTDGADYTESVAQLVESGVLLDSGVVTWSARLSENFPTVELRIADAQLTPDDAVRFGLIVRALVDRAITDIESGTERERFIPGLVDGAIWMAARDGLEGNLIDPASGRGIPAFDYVDQMIASIRQELALNGDTQHIEQYVTQLRDEGGPARRQRERFASTGIQGLLELYREGSRVREPALPTFS